MSTPFDIFGIVGTNTGKKLVARLIFPTGLVTAAGTTHTGGTVTGTSAIDTAASAIYLGLTEEGATGIYSGTSTIAGTALPDTTDRPYTIDAREVSDATDMTSYGAIVAAFAASAEVVYTRDVPAMLKGGWLSNGAWYADGEIAKVPRIGADVRWRNLTTDATDDVTMEAIP